MTGAAKITYFQEILLEWFQENQREFPWRSSGISDFEKVATEVLLQRTQAGTIKKFYSSFFTHFPSWASIAGAPVEEIEVVLKPIGLYKQRASRIKRLAEAVVEMNERFPTTKEELEKTPMVGQYIANCVRLLLFNEPAPLLDVNMARLLERFFGERKLADIRYDPYLQNLAWQVVQHQKAKELNWAILDFAALVCKARRPLCEDCPIRKHCVYFNNQVL